MTSRPNQPKPKGPSPAPADPLAAKIHAQHLTEHPNCTFGDEPHYVPPGAGMIGFYACDLPADLINHTRCMIPYDHEHPDHMSDQRVAEIQEWQAAHFAAKTDAAIDVVGARMSEHFSYGPTPTDPDSGKLWHDGCDQEVVVLKVGYICGCGQQWMDAPGGSGPEPVSQKINTADAVQVIARHFIHGAVERGLLDGAWMLYPEVGWRDWENVESRVKSILGKQPTVEQFQIAYDHLERRAEQWTREHPDGA